MMVKNESRIIRRALDSAWPHVDAWCITDTGSTDGTQSIIQQHLADHGLPGELHQTKFVDFGISRTETLEHARRFCRERGIDYLLLLDADEMIEVRDPHWKRGLSGAPYLLLYDDPLSYRSLYLIPTGPRWRFVGRTHEYLEAVDPCPPRELFDGIVLHDHGDGGSKADKFVRDIRLLRETLRERPNDVRAWFYLGESYFNGRIDPVQALHAYSMRERLGGFEEEAWYASYRRGLCLERIAGADGDPWPPLIAFFQAWERRPWRAEPLFEVVRLCGQRAMHLLGAIVGEYALAHVVTRPEREHDILFVDRPRHGPLLQDWLAVCHYWGGYPARSRELFEQLLGNAPSEDGAERLRRHIEYCKTSPLVLPPPTELLLDACARLRHQALPLSCLVIADAAAALLDEQTGDIPWQLQRDRALCGPYVRGRRQDTARLTA